MHAFFECGATEHTLLQKVYDAWRVSSCPMAKHPVEVDGLCRPITGESELSPSCDIASLCVDRAKLCERKLLEGIVAVHIDRDSVRPTFGRVTTPGNCDKQWGITQLSLEAGRLRRKKFSDEGRDLRCSVQQRVERFVGQIRVATELDARTGMRATELLSPGVHQSLHAISSRNYNLTVVDRLHLRLRSCA